METTRPALEDDRAACVALLTRALSDVATMRGGATLRGNIGQDELLARWLRPDGDDAALYVGEFQDVVVGLARPSPLCRRRTTVRSGRIECCYVEEGARGVGVGTALMESMVAWCTRRGCTDVDALALPGDRLSKQRLEAAGFTARLLALSRRLS